MGIVLILVRKKYEVTVELLKGGYLKLWKCVKWEEVPKIKFKCFIPLIKVNIIKFNYDQVFYINSNVNALYFIRLY